MKVSILLKVKQLISLKLRFENGHSLFQGSCLKKLTFIQHSLYARPVLHVYKHFLILMLKTTLQSGDHYH